MTEISRCPSHVMVNISEAFCILVCSILLKATVEMDEFTTMYKADDVTVRNCTVTYLQSRPVIPLNHRIFHVIPRSLL